MKSLSKKANDRAIKIFATIGPSSTLQKVLKSFRNKGVDYVRINLSHTEEDKIESILKKMLKTGIEVVIDTEGSQVRTGDLGKEPLLLKEGAEIRIFNKYIKSTRFAFYIRPKEFTDFLTPGSLISVDFDSVLLKVRNINKLKNQEYIDAVVLIGGTIGNNKAVHSDTVPKLPALSKKDLLAIDLSKKNKIKYFTLSYIDNANEVTQFKKLYPEAIAYSKIETKQGVINFGKILKVSD